MYNPYSYTDLMGEIKYIMQDCSDSYTKDRLNAIVNSEALAKAYEEGFNACKVQQSYLTSTTKLVVLPQSAIDAAMQYFPSKKINAIKALRNATGFGLKDSKDAVDALFEQEMDKLHQSAIYLNTAQNGYGYKY